MSFNELRLAAGMTIADISKYFNIPYRTAQNWDNGVRACADYIIELMRFKLAQEGLIKKQKV